MFAAIVDFLVTVLGLFFDWTGSYGLAIILLTLAVKIVLHPLTRRQLRSMKEMQSLAPQMAALREKYRSDPQRMNMEIMNLYRQHKVNPFGGCLPLIVQMPILYALFAVFRRQGLFDGARFLGVALDAVPNFGAIARDPLLIVWPALVGVSTYLQQRMSVTDPQQARLFILMPIMVAYFAMYVPVAMSVYWVTSTLAYILEFYIVVGRLTPPAPAAPAGAAKPPVAVLPQRPKGTKRK
ncbi:MAG: YidC/Oxa1 family membrane protein insertase [Armatimonadota bacterium]|nr:YidC/Oxa1 family membrane protein insertase [Armatimonadota bacterium]